MYKRIKYIAVLIPGLLLLAFRQTDDTQTFTVINNLEIQRESETISIPVNKIPGLIKRFGIDNLLIKEKNKAEYLLSQSVDTDADGDIDEILFQTNIGPKEEKAFIIEGKTNAAGLKPVSKINTFSRFVPERSNDYAWENDRIAFRMYGLPQGTVTYKPGGGIDAWLKRVNYPIINKWYKNNQEKEGAYHIDTGEGYDPYQVGASRGIGGTGVWAKDSLYVSSDFISSKTIAEGPVRTIFELTYAPWDGNGNKIKQIKRISLDLGSNLTRVEELLVGEKDIPNLVIGITLHDKKGTVNANPREGWFRYWEPMDDSALGTGLVVHPSLITEFKDHRTDTRDQSHLFAFTKAPGRIQVYYAGFAWKKSGQFNTAEEWDAYLKNFARRIASPVVVKF